MKKQLFGLRKAPVNNLLKEIKIDFSSQLVNLKWELVNVKSENSQLQMSIDKETQQKLKFSEEADIWMHGSQERIETLFQFLEQKKVSEMEEVQAAFAERTVKIKQQIEDLEVEMKSVRKVFSLMVKQFAEQMENPKQAAATVEEVTEIGEDLAISQHQAAADAAGLLDGSESDSSYRQPKESLYPQEQSVTEVDEFVWDVGNPPTVESFWGDIAEWSNSNLPYIKEEEPSSLLTSEKDFVQMDEQFSDKVAEKESPRVSSPIKDGLPETNFEKSSEPEKKPVDFQNDILLEQIDSIKNQYIVGKVAGEDLLDHHGRIMVAKNSMITREVVERANEIGKLAELIVNMKLSSGRED
jgi:hypothetical protein